MIGIVASSELWPTPEVVSAVAGVIAATDEEIGIRASSHGTPASHIEEAAMKICDRFGKHYRVYQPIIGEGRAGVFERDFRLAEQSSKVYAWFAPGEEMQGGTGHIVEAALARGVGVEAFRLDDAGNVVLLGSEEGNDHRHAVDSA